MLKFMFIGDPHEVKDLKGKVTSPTGHGPAAIQMFGVVFRKNQVTPLPEGFPEASLRKLRAHTHFKECGPEDVGDASTLAAPTGPKLPLADDELAAAAAATLAEAAAERNENGDDTPELVPLPPEDDIGNDDDEPVPAT